MTWRHPIDGFHGWLAAAYGRSAPDHAPAQALSRLIQRSGVKRAGWVLHYVENTLGGWRSFECRLPVDRDGNPLPWYTYPAIEYLEQLDFSACEVFEYGSGNSSKFWAHRARAVTSVESDPAWYQTGAAALSPNQTLLLKTEVADYAQAIRAKEGKYEVIVVDGVYRYNCAREAVDQVKEGGFILLDNADWHPATARFLREKGLSQVDLIGAGPVNSYAWCTSLFLKGPLAIPRKREREPPRVQAGLVQISEHDRLR